MSHYIQFTKALAANPGAPERFTPAAVEMLAEAASRGWVVIETPEQEDPAGELFASGLVAWKLDVDGNEAVVLTRKGRESVSAAMKRLAEMHGGREADIIWSETLLSNPSNPSAAEGTAIGAMTGWVLLGPLGAIGGGYLGTKIAEAKENPASRSKKSKRKKRAKRNPKRKSDALRRLMRGT